MIDLVSSWAATTKYKELLTCIRSIVIDWDRKELD